MLEVDLVNGPDAALRALAIACASVIEAWGWRSLPSSSDPGLTHAPSSLISREPGPPKASVAPTRTSRTAAETAAAHGSAVELHVRDEGVGFPDGFVAKAFEPFSRAVPAGDGNGLGLAIVATIVRAHGGEVAVNPTPRGADVSIRLRL